MNVPFAISMIIWQSQCLLTENNKIYSLLLKNLGKNSRIAYKTYVFSFKEVTSF